LPRSEKSQKNIPLGLSGNHHVIWFIYWLILFYFIYFPSCYVNSKLVAGSTESLFWEFRWALLSAVMLSHRNPWVYYGIGKGYILPWQEKKSVFPVSWYNSSEILYPNQYINCSVYMASILFSAGHRSITDIAFFVSWIFYFWVLSCFYFKEKMLMLKTVSWPGIRLFPIFVLFLSFFCLHTLYNDINNMW